MDRIGRALGVMVVAGTAAWAGAQTSSAPACGDKQGQKPCAATTPAQQFPYPGDVPSAPAAPAVAPDAPVREKFPYPGDTPAAPSAPSAPKDGGKAAGAFPYPGETKDSPDIPPMGPEFKPAGGDDALPPSSSSGGSSSSSSSSGGGMPDAEDKPAFKDEGSAGDTQTTRRRRLRPQAQKTLCDEERADEDLSVAKFYTSTGNMQGAYMRAKDAVKVQPNDPETHLALAGVAEKMGKKDEAVTEYTAYIKLDPDGEHVKAAQRALGALKP